MSDIEIQTKPLKILARFWPSSIVPVQGHVYRHVCRHVHGHRLGHVSHRKGLAEVVILKLVCLVHTPSAMPMWAIDIQTTLSQIEVRFWLSSIVPVC